MVPGGARRCTQPRDTGVEFAQSDCRGRRPAGRVSRVIADSDERRNDVELVLLGRFGDVNFFAYDIDSSEPPPLQAGTRFEDLRIVAAVLPIDEAGLLGYARAIVSWRRRHRFCGLCGARTLSAKGGHVLVCSDPPRRHEQFPRIDPAIIVLVSDGERALLGGQSSWPVGRYPPSPASSSPVNPWKMR